MTETLTESFCERCGTRYEFKAPTRLNPLRKTRGFIGGLKNYLTSQDALSDAMGDAMRSEEDQLASAQLEAFHESFNFCIDCRQYTCLNCWNDDAGRCRSCAPIPGTDDLAERLAASYAGAPVADAVAPEAQPMPDAWPTVDLPELAPTNGHAIEPWPEAEPLPAATSFEAEPEPEPVVAEEPEPVVAEPEPEPVIAEEPEPVLAAWEPEAEPIFAEAEPEPVVDEVEPEPEPVVAEEIEPEPVVAEEPEAVIERPPLRVVAWEEDGAYEVAPEAVAEELLVEPVAAEVEPEPVVAEIEPEPEPVVAEAETAPEPEPVVAEEEPEPVVAEAAPEQEQSAPEPEAAPRPRIAPISETILRFPSQEVAPPPAESDERVAAQADTPEAAARRAQLDLLGLGDPGEGPVTPQRPAVLPYRSRGAAISQGELAARAAAAQGGGFWEASAREVASAIGQVGVQSCGQCGLSLSANARFCRRCGTRQARSA